MRVRRARLETRVARRALSTLAVAAAAVAALPSPAAAVLANATATLAYIDWFGHGPTPAPLLLGPGPSAGPDRITFSYDTAAAQHLSPNRYDFTQSASMSLTTNGWTYSTTASASNPLEIRVTGGQGNNDHFSIVPLGIASSPGGASDFNASDPGNPVAAFPYVSLMLGYNALANDDLPTASFPGQNGLSWMDADVFLRSPQGIGPVNYSMMFIVTSEFTITTTAVPVPATLALPGSGLPGPPLAGVAGTPPPRPLAAG